MGVDVSHLVLIALCDTGDEVLDDGLDSAESSDVFAAAVVDLDRDNILLGEGEADGKVGEIFCQFAWWRTLSAILNTNGLNTAAGVVRWVDWAFAGNGDRFEGRRVYLVGLLL